MNSVDESPSVDAEARQPKDAGYLKYYGLYWDRKYWDRHENAWVFDRKREYRHREILPGLPSGWVGRGTKSLDTNDLWVNFWRQKGVYVLYDEQLIPVYSGQAGLQNSNSSEARGRFLGNRLAEHAKGKYRNAWRYFSWFGFMELSDNSQKLRKNLRNCSFDDKINAEYKFSYPADSLNESEKRLNQLLNSFEAILIEAFVPRFNSRGGNLKGAVYVDQFEGDLFLSKI